jgi:hypothetical protein
VKAEIIDRLLNLLFHYFAFGAAITKDFYSHQFLRVS